MGQGTAGIGEDQFKRRAEINAICYGLDLGLSVIDTAELYADGNAEMLVGTAIRNRRSEVYLVSKVIPKHADYKGTKEACQRSLKRLKTDFLDLYLLHWRGDFPLSETLSAFQALKKEGAILDYGISNFSLAATKMAVGLSGGEQIVTNQVLYNLHNRNIELDLMPWCEIQKIPLMAYSPFGQSPEEQRSMFVHPEINAIASEHKITVAQVILAWLICQKVVVIPKASNRLHIKDNHESLNVVLTENDLKRIDKSFPRVGQNKA